MSNCIKVCTNVQGYIEKCNELDRLMFDCWRKGYKHSKIVELAQELDSTQSSETVKDLFSIMFKRELGNTPKYLNK